MIRSRYGTRALFSVLVGIYAQISDVMRR